MYTFASASAAEFRFFARLGKNAISIYECPDMGLLDKKSLKLDAVQVGSAGSLPSSGSLSQTPKPTALLSARVEQ